MFWWASQTNWPNWTPSLRGKLYQPDIRAIWYLVKTKKKTSLRFSVPAVPACVSALWRRLLSTWPTFLRTAGTKSRRTCLPTEVTAVICLSHWLPSGSGGEGKNEQKHYRLSYQMCSQYVWMDCANGNKQQPMACSLLCSWPGYLYHQISVGHGQVPDQTVAEKHLWDHLQGTARHFPPLLPKVMLSPDVWLLW